MALGAEHGGFTSTVMHLHAQSNRQALRALAAE